MIRHTISCIENKSITLARLRLPFILCVFILAALNRATEVKSACWQDSHVAQEIASLAPGNPIEDELAGGQKRSYYLALAQGQYAKVIVEQRGIDVVARLFGIDGKLIIESDSETRLTGPEAINAIAGAGGNYRLEVEAKSKTGPSGRCEIRLAELRIATGKDRSLEEARTLMLASGRLLREDKPNEARPLVERALAIREEMLGPDDPDIAQALHSLGKISYSLYEYEKAEPLYQRAIAIKEKALGPDHPAVAISLASLGNVYHEQNKYSKAGPLYQRVLEISERAYGPDSPEAARAVNLLANNYSDLHDYARSELLFRRSLNIAEKVFGPTHQYVGHALSNLAIDYMQLGDYEKVEPMFERSLKILENAYGKENQYIGPTLINIGNLYRNIGEFDKALSSYQRLMGIWEKVEPESYDLTIVLENIGGTYVDLGNYEKAEPMLKRSLEIREKIYGAQHPRVALSLTNLAGVYRAQGDYVKAESLYRRALEIKQRAFGEDSPELAETLKGLAILYRAKGDAARSVSCQVRANAIIERNTAYNLAMGSDRQRLAYLALLSEDADITISLHNQMSPENADARAMAATTVLQRKGRALDSMTDTLTVLRRRFSAEDQALIDQLNETNSQLASLALNGPQKISLGEHEKKIKTLEEQREKLEIEMSRRSAGFYQRSQTVTLADVRAAIPDEAALIEFAVYHPFDPRAKEKKAAFGAPRYVAYIIRKQGQIQWKELGDAKTIDETINDLREALRDWKRQDIARICRAADEKIMRPIRPLLGDSTRLLISPDGALNLIPFEALVDERDQYLIERYSFAYLTSGRDLLRMQVARSSGSSPLVMANPLFGEPDQMRISRVDSRNRRSPAPGRRRQSVITGDDLSSAYFAPLSGTAKEAESIASMFPDATVVAGAQATESWLKRAVAPRILHIATHGYFLSDSLSSAANSADGLTRGIQISLKIENPLLRSGLALAGANLRASGKDDGILTALEASGLNLWGTKLVTLSACDTGLGEVKNGEGVYGLRRAFVLAGTESLIMSLWPVSDYVTRELMSDYYRGLKQGQGRGEALRQVQLMMLKRKDRHHPFYWASFIQSGEWANLDGKR